MDSLYCHEYDPVLKKYVYASGTTHINRSEGWASTWIGKYNTFAVRDIEKNSSIKVAIWGNSEVEGFQVPDSCKMAQQATQFFQKRGVNELAFAVAHSGNRLADYYFDIPKYEHILSNIISHYIIICDLRVDALPNDTGNRSKFLYESGFLLTESDCKPPQQEIIHFLSKYKLRIVSYMYGRLTDMASNFFKNQFHQSNPISDNNEPTPYNKKDAWKFILRQLRRQTQVPLTIVYCPYVPVIEKGKVILEDPSREDKLVFATLCQEEGVNFIDLTEPFIRLYLQAKEFPRGFSNTTPSIGHLNENGQKVAAMAIFEHESKR